jgi:hypothetical protein
MPAVSQAQRGYLASKFGPAWMRKHHFDNKGQLPQHVGGKGAARREALRRMRKKRHA